MRSLRVLVVDDDPDTCSFLQAVLGAEGHQCDAFLCASDAEQHLRSHRADLALVDVYLGDDNGVDLVQRFRGLQPDLHAVVMTAQVSLETAARSLAEGAVDYISKPLDISRIRELCRRTAELATHDARRSRAELPPQVSTTAMVGKSPRMLEVFKDIGRVASSNANVLITGASGTGKELVARAIHLHSKRAEQPFVPVNCGSLTETILESELFGHEKGAFTGADRLHKGLVEASTGGTLFLDEVTETALSFQVKLLRVIQEQQVRRVGSNSSIPVDVRIIAASNRDVPDLMRRGLFREDLYYRLSVVQIAVPSLEERREDIPLLIAHFLQQFTLKNDRTVAIDLEAIECLQAQSWPGNVRELENTINRLAIFARTGRISVVDVKAEAQRVVRADPQVRGLGAAAPDRLLELERQHIIHMLKATHGNKSEAARRLGIERKTLYKKAVRLGIDLQTVEEP
jgi:DNA-binding NtrC family response regulator